ncbi:MAG: hypothetical protein R3185_05700, partial [Candidatus Thermoplasmatota archaeon]|nr:hypothetical protein [Candidatus Thermoplasmatota archaeon]
MKLTHTQRGLLAAALVISMIVAGFPMVLGDHSPDLSTVEVNEIRDGDCLSLALEPERVDRLVAMAQNATGDPANATDELPLPEQGEDGALTVPTICEARPEFRALIEAGNAALTTLDDVLGQLDAAQHENAPLQKISFLGETFQAPRIGGIGDWQVRTAGDKLGFRSPIDEAVTDGYALTDQPGDTYENGLNTTLISPAIDLGGVATPEELASFPTRARELMHDRLPAQVPLYEEDDDEAFEFCVPPISVFGQGTPEQCILQSSLGTTQEVYSELRAAYLAEADQALADYEERLGAVTLTIQHQFNLAQGFDGVRYEVLTEPPRPVGLPQVGEVIEPSSSSNATGYEEVAAYNGNRGFTGTSSGWTEERFELSRFAGERIWIVVRAKTNPAFGLESFFQDPSLFTSQKRYGYALGGLFVNATAHETNLRVLGADVGQVPVDGRPTAPSPLSERRANLIITNQGHQPATAQVSLTQCMDRCTTIQVGERTL